MLPDLLGPNLALVVCGSAAGEASAARGAYYAGPGNLFWHTLAAVGLTPRQLAPSDFRLLADFRIGLTDLVKTQAGNDSAIRFDGVDRPRLTQAILKWQPRYLCFNGKRAAKEYFDVGAIDYGLQSARLNTTRVFVAPSTSGAARKSWDLSVWQNLADVVHAIAEQPG